MVDEHPSPGGAASIWFVDGFFDGFARSPIRGVALRNDGGNSFLRGHFVMVFAKGKNVCLNESRMNLNPGFREAPPRAEK